MASGRCLATSARQRVAALAVGGRHVDAQGAQRRPATVADLVPVAALDEKERPFSERITLAVDDGQAFAGEDVKPLVAAAVTVIRSALGIARSEHHLGRLAA